MHASTTIVPLGGVSFVLARGDDAHAFLDGQFSNVLPDPAGDGAVLGAFCTPKGRVSTIARIGPYRGGLLVALDSELAEVFIASLTRYILRAKVTLTRLQSVQAIGAIGAATAANLPGVCRWRLTGDGDDTLTLIASETVTDTRGHAAARQDWALREIRAGLPTLSTATTGRFVPQMLNLDLLEGISFSKGCYTGQEIVARTHNLGRIKRRMLRFAAAGAPPVSGEPIVNARGEAIGQVVRAVATAAGSELLGVIRLSALDSTLHIATPDGAPLKRLPLPYAVPEINAG